MNAAYITAAEKILSASLFFAAGGYHVKTTFGYNNTSMDITVFFHNCDDKNLIESFMTRYEEENDKIEFTDFSDDNKSPFYTITLSKYLS